MTSHSSMESGFRLEAAADGAAQGIDLHVKHLNFDVSEALKTGMEEAVEDALEKGCRTFLVGLEHVATVDSSGVGMLVGVHHQVVAAGGVVAFTGCNEYVRKVLRMMRLERFLVLYEDREKALEALVERS